MLSVSSQRKYTFYHHNTLLDAFRTNSDNIIGRDLSTVMPLIANQHFNNEFSQRYWPESFDGDSFASQSTFDAYGM